MDKEKSNLDNYINSLDKALKNASNCSSLQQIAKDFEHITRDFEFLLSDDKLCYEMGEKPDKKRYIEKIEWCNDESIHFVLVDLLPHRLDYHKLGASRAAKMNYVRFSGFQRDAFDFLRQNSVQPASEKMCLIFINYYTNEERRKWDNDNLDVKVFIDAVISKRFVLDDSHEYLSYCMISKKGEYTHTEAYLCKEDRLNSLFNTIFLDT